MILIEDLVILVNLSQLMADKIEEPISHVQGWINGWIAIAVVRSYSGTIHRDHPPITLPDRDSDWKSSSGLGLAK